MSRPLLKPALLATLVSLSLNVYGEPLTVEQKIDALQQEIDSLKQQLAEEKAARVQQVEAPPKVAISSPAPEAE
ncbi:MAG: hypothetical protein ACLPXB_12000, partial [Thiobacillaceae bacterium]